MAKPNHDEREFVRIDTYLPLRCQRLNSLEYCQEKARILRDRQARMNPFLQLMERWSSQEEQGPRGAELERLVAPVLATMNEKLDRILAVLNPSDPIALRFEEPQALNISGAGVGLALREYVPLDTALALEFFLPLPFPLRIKAIGKVNRVEAVRLEPQQWYTATTFDVIHEEDREAIIRYIFREQRMLLRTRHTPMLSTDVEPRTTTQDLRAPQA